MATLNEVLLQTNWYEVKKSLLKLYCDEDRAEEFKRAYVELKSLEPKKEERIFVIDIEESVQEEEDENGKIKEYTYWDVDGFYPDEQPSVRYGISLCDRNEWLGYSISEKVMDKYSFSDIIAHCLHEMTFYGMSNQDIIDLSNELQGIPNKFKGNNYNLKKAPCSFCKGTKYIDVLNQRCNLCDENGEVSVMVFDDEALD